MNLREFRALELARLARIRDELMRKYPERADRVREVCDQVASKLYALRAYTLADFIYMLYNLSSEFPELKELIPSEDVVKELIGGGGNE